MSPRKKYIYSPFKKHFWIPFGLSLFIIAVGVVMLVTDQQEIGRFHSWKNKYMAVYVTGPSTIGLGIAVAIIVLWMRKWIK